MGSTGSGSFSDYSQRKSKNEEDENGGSSNTDKCGLAFSTYLDEVSRSFYYVNKKSLPSSGTEVSVSFNGSRLVVETKIGEELGYLPTRFNYLKVCMDDGFKYHGTVSNSRLKPIPAISVDIIPE